MNYTQLNRILDRADEAMHRLEEEHSLRRESDHRDLIERWNWDQPEITLSWVGNDTISRNIVVHMGFQQTTDLLIITEVNGWKDEDNEEGSTRIRRWQHQTISAVPESSLDKLSDTITQAYSVVSGWQLNNLERQSQISNLSIDPEQIYKDQLIQTLRIGGSFLAQQAIDTLREREWLTRGSLRAANLENAYLLGAILSFAQLPGVNLNYANLQRAALDHVNLEEAQLREANLRKADLSEANLRKANLSGANLQSANLFKAFLKEALFNQAIFNPETILPDGRAWSPDTDMRRYTNSERDRFNSY